MRTHVACLPMLLLAAGCGYSASINLSSSAAGTSNSSGNPTMAIAPDSVWSPPFAGSSWISYVDSGNQGDPGYVSPPNGTSIIFTDTFTLAGTPTGGTLDVMADDTTSVSLNGVLLVPFPSSIGNTYKICSDYSIGCLAKTAGTVNLSSALQPGVNTLSFDVSQVNGVAFGLDYSGSVQYSAVSNATSVPEPSDYVLFGLAFIGCTWVWCRPAKK